MHTYSNNGNNGSLITYIIHQDRLQNKQDISCLLYSNNVGNFLTQNLGR